MAGAVYRIRRRVKDFRDSTMGEPHRWALDQVIGAIDEEIERDAEFEFTRPLNPDPTTNFAKELKDEAKTRTG